MTDITAPDAWTAVGSAPLLTGTTVILTGAAGGIGATTARMLAAAGARVALTDRFAQTLAPVAAELGDDAFAEAIDASDRAQFRGFVERVEQRLGPVDGLVNCAGIWETGSFTELEEDAWDRVVRANLDTAVAGCRAVLPGMIERGSGSIVNFASTSGEYGAISPAAHYAVAKGGVIALTKTLAREAGPHQIRVNAVSPGPIGTPSLIGGTTAEQQASVGARTLFGRLGRPEEIAAACVFLLSPLSTFVHGHVLRVNGGSLL
ncbi:MAG: short-chain dehydrogenase/reductase [Conexibacter sp.]|jgi:NAD(P)-dependent dehydrogenase (short-subunit alcohol dehydrogenase family)|nr:short-chain dehydrogenase/reductase [Conexibacter sp.]